MQHTKIFTQINPRIHILFRWKNLQIVPKITGARLAWVKMADIFDQIYHTGFVEICWVVGVIGSGGVEEGPGVVA